MDLYVKGKIPELGRKIIAVVGAVKVSPRGEVLTKKFIKELVKSGFTIVSGFSDGVDKISLKTGLKKNGKVVAVLGCGLDLISEKDKGLSDEIIKDGALISPFPDGTKESYKNYKTTNMTIASLAEAVLIIEDRKISESASVASFAADNSIDVFAVPGSELTDFLIGDGAVSATKPADVLDIIL